VTDAHVPPHHDAASWGWRQRPRWDRASGARAPRRRLGQV
jgi:hypothetical protein